MRQNVTFMDLRSLQSAWAGPLCHPWMLCAALVLSINDHWLKSAGLLPGAVTGKLSDFAGLFLFPAFLLAALRGMAVLTRSAACARAARWAGTTWLIAAATGVAFAAANLSTPFNDWLAGWFGHKELDPSDLLALPMLLGAAGFLQRWAR